MVNFCRRIPRPTDVPDSGLICDLLWSDPDKEIEGWVHSNILFSVNYGSCSGSYKCPKPA